MLFPSMGDRKEAAVAHFSRTRTERTLAHQDDGDRLENGRIPVAALMIGSMGLLNCASTIVTLIMAG